MKNIKIMDFCKNQEIINLAKEKGFLYSITFNFVPDEEILIFILNHCKYSTGVIDVNIEIMSRKYPDILFEYGDISWFLIAVLNGEVVKSFSPKDWKDKGSTEYFEAKVEEYNEFKSKFPKIISISG